MHTKGKAAEQLRESLKLDTCVYLGNDLNDITMFSNALEDNDFIVIASHENKEITDMLINYLKEESKVKGINWDDVRLLVLQDKNVNRFLNKMSGIMRVISLKKQERQGVRLKYRVNIKQQNKVANQKKREIDRKRKHRSRYGQYR